LIVHWPDRITDRGQLRQVVGHVIDVVPTVLEAAQAELPTDWQGEPLPPKPGKSLLPALEADGPIQREDLWWLHEGNRAMRVGDWKLVAAGAEAPWELYDLSQDRSEMHNLADTHAEKVRQLARRWQQRVDEFTALARPAATSLPEP
jgi:arylsulfatase